MMTSQDFDYVRALVREHSAIVLGNDKAHLVETRLHGLLRQTGNSSIHLLIQELRHKPFGELHRQVVEAMTTNETFFFRDQWPFAVLAQQVLPELVSVRAVDREVTLWSAACAAGQEPYSLAMVMDRSPMQAFNWRIRILGTDLSQQMVDRTRTGRYSRTEIERGLAPDLRERYFSQEGEEWVAREAIRSMVETRVLNLAQPWPPLPKMDVIFLRNVLIYFDVETRRRIVDQVRRQLHPHGVLFLGSTENILGLDDSFERVADGKHVHYRLRPTG